MCPRLVAWRGTAETLFDTRLPGDVFKFSEELALWIGFPIYTIPLHLSAQNLHTISRECNSPLYF